MANFPNFYTLLGPNVASGVASGTFLHCSGYQN